MLASVKLGVLSKQEASKKAEELLERVGLRIASKDIQNSCREDKNSVLQSRGHWQ